MLDLNLSNTLSRLCNGVSRRNFVRVGALAPLGLSLPQLLAGEIAARPARAKSVILIYLGGGLSHHDSFDMKPEAVEQIRGKYKSIATTVPGLQICELLPKTAQVMNKLTLVRSGTHENDHHETATNWVLSGRFGTPFGDHPAIGAIVAHETGFSGAVPPYVAVPRNPSFTWELGKSVWLGGRCESFKAGNPNDANYRVRDLSAPSGITPQTLDRRKSLLAAVDQLAQRVKGSDQIATYDEFSRKAAEMVLSPQAQAAFAIDREETKTRDEYGRNEFGQSALLARRLVENGVRFVTINYGGWDHHGEIFKGLDQKLPEFDQGFSALIIDLDQRGLLDDTLVLAMGEFGRTPKVNDKAGRDHWGRAGSMLWAGAGVSRGRVLGATDKNGAFVTDRPVRPADVAWTVYESLGIDPAKELLTPEGRPVSILAEGASVTELFYMKRSLVVFVLVVYGLSYCFFDCLLIGSSFLARAQEAKNEVARITATEPASLVWGAKTNLTVRGFKLKEATELRFPMATEVKAEIREKKDSDPPKGLENKLVGDTQLLAEITLPANHPSGILEFVIATPAGDAAGKILVLAVDTSIDELEPNNGFGEAQKLQLNQSARGSIQSDKDVDVYTFDAKAGQQLKVTVTSGSPTIMDAALHCYDARGQFVAAADDGESRDPVLMLRPLADGATFLCVSNAHDIGGGWQSYLLTVEKVK